MRLPLAGRQVTRGEGTRMFRRAKLMPADVPSEALADVRRHGVPVGRLALADARGNPACGRVMPRPLSGQRASRPWRDLPASPAVEGLDTRTTSPSAAGADTRSRRPQPVHPGEPSRTAHGRRWRCGAASVRGPCPVAPWGCPHCGHRRRTARPP
ncbi:DUF5990 family protein [Streptomyces sp. NPDC050422]|uniref:DUF5990 family protein n=1 Tax=Streptomyces sp. NPDC050422 TaxID=3365614 RepID=UPI0037BE1DC1